MVLGVSKIVSKMVVLVLVRSRRRAGNWTRCDLENDSAIARKTV